TPMPGNRVRLVSATLHRRSSEFGYALGKERRARRWGDYVQGVTWLLRKEGHVIDGFHARVSSTVPLGSGLSSSAALEVAALRALREAFALKIDDLEIAKLGQRVENEFVGARVGIMDQMAASLCDGAGALFIDTHNLSYRQIPLPPNSEILVINSGVSHSNVHGDYNTRRSECEQACARLGVKLLRELDENCLSRIEALPEPLCRRARHVVTENARVLRAVAAMEKDDLETLGRLFCQSHASMRDDYQVSVPEIDLLVDLAMKEPGVCGARLTGGGFGGSIVALARRGFGAAAANNIVGSYNKAVAFKATVLLGG
ncbi:MAG TPA: hypothetical protein PLL10_05590, partial [Elusimicrobiales bacterium]|nr:hypothetical protein [Elusimicrobiales bacterium]